MNRMVIKPRVGSGRLRNHANIGDMNVIRELVDEKGQKYEESEGRFKGERLPNTGGNKRPMYSSAKRKWSLVLDNGKEADEDWLQILVKRAKLRYEDGHKKAGELITHADMFDIDDEFFNHRELAINLDEGVGSLDPDNPVHVIVAAGLRGDKDVGSAADKAFSQNMRFILVDPNHEVDQESKRINKKAEAYRLFFGMDLEKKKLVVKLMRNRDYIAEPSEDLLNTELGKAIESTTTTTSGRTLLEEFLHIAQMDNERLKLKDLIQQGVRGNIINFNRGNYHFNNKLVAHTMDELEYHFGNHDNYEDMERLYKRLGVE